MIPKVIHYCWFGRNPKPELVQNCIASWKKYCPDYEIVEWNEDNFDVNYCKFTEEAYKAKKWAFVSDVARLVAVYENGGIYLDTDVELKQSLDSLLQYDVWFVRENEVSIATGLGFGAVKQSALVKQLIDVRVHMDGAKYMPCPSIDGPIIRSFFHLGYGDKTNVVGNSIILNSNTYSDFAIHHAFGSWLNSSDKVVHKNYSKASWKFKSVLRNPKMLNFIEKHSNSKVMKLYMFFVYDLLDFGVVHFLKKFGRRLLRKGKK